MPRDMLMVSGRVPIYLTIDALDECPNTEWDIDTTGQGPDAY